MKFVRDWKTKATRSGKREVIDYRCKSVALFSQFRLLRQLSFSSTLSWKKKKRKKRPTRQAAEVVLRLVREQKKNNLLYRRQKRKKCDSQKGEEWVGKCLGLPCFLTLNVDNVKEGFSYSWRNVSALSVIFKRTRKGLKHFFGSIENGAEVFEYGMVMKL